MNSADSKSNTPRKLGPNRLHDRIRHKPGKRNCSQLMVDQQGKHYSNPLSCDIARLDEQPRPGYFPHERSYSKQTRGHSSDHNRHTRLRLLLCAPTLLLPRHQKASTGSDSISTINFPQSRRTTQPRAFRAGFCQLGCGEFFYDSCYPLASLDEHVDPLVLVRGMSIALGMITANGHCRQTKCIRVIVHGTRSCRGHEDNGLLVKYFPPSPRCNLRDRRVDRSPCSRILCLKIHFHIRETMPD